MIQAFMEYVSQQRSTLSLGDIYLFLLILLVALCLTTYRSYFKCVWLALTTPGPPATPLIGNSLMLSDHEKLEKLGNKGAELYGSIIRFWMSILPVFLITEPDHIRMIIGNNRSSTKSIFYCLVKNFIGEGLLTSDGETWRNNRRIIQPLFHINILKEFCEIFENESKQLVQNLRNKTDVKITGYINESVIRILYDAVLGICPEGDVNFSPYRKGRVLVSYRVSRPWLIFDSIFQFTSTASAEVLHNKELRDYTQKIFESKKKTTHSNLGRRSCLMEMMIAASKENHKLTDEDVIKESCTLMLAGQESVATALAFTLYLLAKHQDVQERVMEELTPIFSENDNNVTLQDLNRMVYLEQCIKEALRLFPPLPIITRKLTEDLVMNKRTFPKGTNILLSPFLTHRLPHIFSNPLEFRPERFSAENQMKMHPYAFFPFSAGPRNCIGWKFSILEMKMVISHLLSNYHLSITPGHEDLKLAYRVTLRAKGGIHIRLRERKLHD